MRFLSGHTFRLPEMRLLASGSENGRWKGGSVGYAGLHKWVRHHRPRTGTCSVCDFVGYTECANLSGEYRRDLDDFAEMCKPCHKAYDAAAA